MITITIMLAVIGGGLYFLYKMGKYLNQRRKRR